MLLGKVIDKLHQQHGFANAGAAEETDFAAFCIGADQVHDLDAGFKQFRGGLLLIEGGGWAVDGPPFCLLRHRTVIHRLAQQIENSAEAFFAHRHGDGFARVHSVHAAFEPVGGAHGNAAGHIVADQLGNLQGQFTLAVFDFHGVQKTGQRPLFKANVQHRPHDLHHFTDIFRQWSSTP